MTVSMRVMSAGDGYRYLLASVTAGDVACHVPWLIVNYVEKGCLIAQQILPARSSRADGRRKVRQLVKAARRRAAGRGAARPGLDPRFGYFRLSDGRPSHVAAAVGTVGCLPNVARYVRLTYMSEARSDQAGSELATLRQRLVEAEEEYRRTRAEDYVVRLVRDAAIVDAHRGGMSSREISALVGDIGQPNVVRTRRRAITRRDVVPHGLLDPADAVRVSGLGPRAFISAVREGWIKPTELAGGVKAFRREDVDALAERASHR